MADRSSRNRATLPPKSTIGLAVAAALAGATAPRAPALAATGAEASGALQEVVVTARKREENLQDVPISMEVLTQKDLQNLGIVRFDDYAYRVPSISFISIGPGTQTFYMRGVSAAGGTNAEGNHSFSTTARSAGSGYSPTCTSTISSASRC